MYRAVVQHGQVIDLFVSPRRGIPAARRFFSVALAAHGEPDEVVTDLAQTLETVIEELVPDAFHNTERYARETQTDAWPQDPLLSIDGDLRSSVHPDSSPGPLLGVEASTCQLRVAAAFDELAEVI